MSVNLVNRVPIPGSFGVQPSSDVVMHIQTTGTVPSASITIAINGHNAVLLGAFQAGYAGTILTDGSGGWNVTINPSTNFAFGATVTVAVSCVENPGAVPFSQSYSFQTVRDIRLTSAVCYFEEGDVLEADLWLYEGQVAKPLLVNALTFTLQRNDIDADSIVVENHTHDMHVADGSFKVRLLHPKQISKDMTFECAVDIDGYQAPGIGTLTIANVIEWEARQQNVLQPQTQPATRAAETVPHTEPSEYATTAVQQQKQAEYEVVDVSKTGDALVEPAILVDLDFLNGTQYLQALEGDLAYVGGGNRLLTGIDDTTDWFLQEADELPVTFGARTLVEGSATNLLPHSSFDVNQFNLVLPDVTVRGDVEISDLTNGVKQLLYAMEGSIIFDGTPRNVLIQSPKVPITTGLPVLMSILARTALRDKTVTLDTFALRARFYNNVNAQVYSADFNFDVFAFESDTAFSLMEAFIPSGSIPGSATQASFDIVTGSWEGCDLMNLWLAAPMIEHAMFATSRVVGPTAPLVRAADDFRIQQYGNLNQLNGRITLNYSPQYEGSPPVNVTLFDTRATGTFRSGYTLRHRSDGKFELTAVDAAGTTTTAITAAAVPLTYGSAVELVAQWTPQSLRILKDLVVLAQQTGSYPQPSSPQTQISIAQKIDGTEQLYGEVHRFVSYGIA